MDCLRQRFPARSSSPRPAPFSPDDLGLGLRRVEAAGTNLFSPAYLSQLRTGQRAEPSHSRLAAIARFFAVDTGYFSGSGAAAAETDEQLELRAAMRDSGVRTVALRAAGLSEASLAAVRAVIDNARRLEGLPVEGLPGDGPRAPDP